MIRNNNNKLMININLAYFLYIKMRSIKLISIYNTKNNRHYEKSQFYF